MEYSLSRFLFFRNFAHTRGCLFTAPRLRPYLAIDRTARIDLFENHAPDCFGEHGPADFLAGIDDHDVRYLAEMGLSL